MSPCPFPTTITITPQAPPKAPIIIGITVILFHSFFSSRAIFRYKSIFLIHLFIYLLFQKAIFHRARIKIHSNVRQLNLPEIDYNIIIIINNEKSPLQNSLHPIIVVIFAYISFDYCRHLFKVMFMFNL